MDIACKWAYERMNKADFVVLDTESTSLDGEIVDIAILDATGAVIFDSLIKPIGKVTETARRVHHISDEMLERAPSFAEVWPQIWSLLAGRSVITYNADFDFSMIALSLLSNGMKDDESYKAFTTTERIWHCLMKRYQEHAHKARWQRLEIALQQQGLPANNTHRALADAQAAYNLLKHLADKYPGSEYEAWQIEREKKEAEEREAARLSQFARAQETDDERAHKIINWLKEQEA